MNRLLGPTTCLALLLVALVATQATAAEKARRQRAGHDMERQRIEQQIRAGRSMTKRIQRDPRVSAEVKQKAAELDQLLDARERTLAKLDTQYRDFLAQHKTEIDEIEELRRRALAIDERLGQARNALVQANQPEIDELKRTSEKARELVDSLRSEYNLSRRTRRQQ